MKLSLILFTVLVITPVFLLPVEEENEKTAIASDDEDLLVDEEVQHVAGGTQVAESVTKNESDGSKTPRKFEHGRKFHSREKSRTANQVYKNPGKRGHNSRRRPANEKKGHRKEIQALSIVFREQTPFTEHFNEDIDAVLVDLFNFTANNTRRNGINFHLRVANIPPRLKISPWTLVYQSQNETEAMTYSTTDRTINQINETAVEVHQIPESETGDIVVLLESAEDKKIGDIQEDADEATTEISNENVTKTDSEIRENPANADAELEKSGKETKIVVVGDDDDEDEGEDEDEDDDDDRDEVEETKTENAAVAVTVDAQIFTICIDDEDQAKCIQEESKNETSVDWKPSKILPDGSVEFVLKLTGSGEVEDQMDQTNSTALDGFRGRKRNRHGGRPHGGFRNRPKTHWHPVLPRRKNAFVTGLEQIRRIGDVKIGDEGEVIRVIEVPIEVGPLELVMKRSAMPVLKRSRVALGPLRAKLTLIDLDGKFISFNLRPDQIKPSEALVTIHHRKINERFLKRQSGRVVNHLSNEMARIWNSGYLLHKTEKNLKKLFRRSEEFQDLISSLREE